MKHLFVTPAMVPSRRPVTIDGSDGLSHASMTNGESVRAAGEAHFDAQTGGPLLLTGHG